MKCEPLTECNEKNNGMDHVEFREGATLTGTVVSRLKVGDHRKLAGGLIENSSMLLTDPKAADMKEKLFDVLCAMNMDVLAISEFPALAAGHKSDRDRAIIVFWRSTGRGRVKCVSGSDIYG